MTRRQFAAGLAAAPVLAQLPIEDPPPPGRRPVIHEEPPFAAPLTFQRKDAPGAVEAFPLPQVRLLAGPFQQAADANRAYMSRIPVDRLLHTFRLNAGLASSAAPLGG